jgi:hypothetical protein
MARTAAARNLAYQLEELKSLSYGSNWIILLSYMEFKIKDIFTLLLLPRVYFILALCAVIAVLVALSGIIFDLNLILDPLKLHLG